MAAKKGFVDKVKDTVAGFFGSDDKKPAKRVPGKTVAKKAPAKKVASKKTPAKRAAAKKTKKS
jgi:hypothetical protein